MAATSVDAGLGSGFMMFVRYVYTGSGQLLRHQMNHPNVTTAARIERPLRQCPDPIDAACIFMPIQSARGRTPIQPSGLPRGDLQLLC